MKGHTEGLTTKIAFETLPQRPSPRVRHSSSTGPMRLLALALFLSAGVLLAGESAQLRNGSILHVDRHELEGGKVRLYIGPGFIEIEGSEVLGFEADGAVPP